MVTILYIVGSGHSGTTLLNILLGLHPQIFSVGELHNLHTYVNPDSKRIDKTCMCGEEVLNCPVWGRVVTNAESDLTKRINQPEQFEKRNHDLYRNLIEISGYPIICDSSKSEKRLQSLIESDNFDVKIIHLIRDGRAVAYSKERKSERIKQFTEQEKEEYKYLGKNLNGYNFNNGIKGWANSNIYIYNKYNKNKDYVTVKYEDVVRKPLKEVKRIFSAFNIDTVNSFPQSEKENLHIFAGNRMRSDFDIRKIKLDTEYLNKISMLQWLKSTYQHRKELRTFNYPFLKTI